MRSPDERERRFVAVWDDTDGRLREAVDVAFRSEDRWRDRLHAALAATLGFLAADPALARLYVAEAIFVPSVTSARRRALPEDLGAMIDLGRREAPRVDWPPPEIADGIAGGIWHRIHSLVRESRAGQLPQQLPSFMYFAVLPYLGLEAAQEELCP